jgi:hypothetical protein
MNVGGESMAKEGQQFPLVDLRKWEKIAERKDVDISKIRSLVDELVEIGRVGPELTPCAIICW